MQGSLHACCSHVSLLSVQLPRISRSASSFSSHYHCCCCCCCCWCVLLLLLLVRADGVAWVRAALVRDLVCPTCSSVSFWVALTCSALHKRWSSSTCGPPAPRVATRKGFISPTPHNPAGQKNIRYILKYIAVTPQGKIRYICEECYQRYGTI